MLINISFKQQSIYNNAIQDYARMTSISTTKKPLENQKDSSLFSSISSSLSSFSYNCTKHNECVLMVRSCEAIEAQYGRTVVPALMEVSVVGFEFKYFLLKVFLILYNLSYAQCLLI